MTFQYFDIEFINSLRKSATEKPKFSPLDESFGAYSAISTYDYLIGQDDFDSDSCSDSEGSTTEHTSAPSVVSDSDKSDLGQEKSVVLFKTEMCNSFAETGICRYGKKCKFAHGDEDMRTVVRHPKYKTQVCRNFNEKGVCPYGKRCCFLHEAQSTDTESEAGY